MNNILKAHAARYPQMQPQDAVKLLYQKNFGGGHMIADTARAETYLQNEYASVPHDEKAPLFENIGGGMVRLHLAALSKQRLPLAARLFIFSANNKKGELSSFLSDLELLRQETKNGMFAFSPQDLESYLAGYAAQGYPAVSHSETYRAAYAPAYRVMEADWAALWPLLTLLEEKLSTGMPQVLAMEGRAASGKSTAAERLAALYAAPVVHMDDFFLPFTQRSPERLAEPGGNVHYERFAEEVLPHLISGEAFSYRVFDCSCGDYAEEKAFVPAAPLRIVEGAYCLHPSFGDPYTITAFYTISPENQQQRILLRNGEEMLQRFISRWIPMEETYHTHYGTEQRADVVLRNDLPL